MSLSESVDYADERNQQTAAEANEAGVGSFANSGDSAGDSATLTNTSLPVSAFSGSSNISVNTQAFVNEEGAGSSGIVAATSPTGETRGVSGEVFTPGATASSISGSASVSSLQQPDIVMSIDTSLILPAGQVLSSNQDNEDHNQATLPGVAGEISTGIQDTELLPSDDVNSGETITSDIEFNSDISSDVTVENTILSTASANSSRVVTVYSAEDESLPTVGVSININDVGDETPPTVGVSISSNDVDYVQTATAASVDEIAPEIVSNLEEDTLLGGTGNEPSHSGFDQDTFITPGRIDIDSSGPVDLTPIYASSERRPIAGVLESVNEVDLLSPNPNELPAAAHFSLPHQ